MESDTCIKQVKFIIDTFRTAVARNRTHKKFKKKIYNMLPYGRIALFGFSRGFSVTLMDVYCAKFDRDNIYRNRACSTS